MKIITIFIVISVLFFSIGLVSAENNFTALEIQTEESDNNQKIILNKDYDYKNSDYSRDENFNPLETIINFNITEKTDVNLNTNNISMIYKDGTKYSVTLTDSDGYPIFNQTIYITINNATYNRTSDKEGIVRLNINLDPGNYIVNTYFNGSDIYKNATITTSLLINSTIITDDLVKYYRNNSQYHITIINTTGNRVANAVVTLNINGIIYTRTTNKEGIARLNINLKPEEYIITTSYNGLSVSNTIKVLSTIKSNDIKKYYKNGTQYHVQIVDGKGNPLNGVSVDLNINGVIYTRKTGVDGFATLNINLDPGEYIITATFNGLSKSNIIKILPKLIAHDLNKIYGENKSYDVQVLDGKGNPIANTDVTFNVNGVFYIRQSNLNGTASLNINLNSGNYIISSYHNGSSISNTIHILSYNSILSANNIYMVSSENRVFNVHLTDLRKNPIANGTISIEMIQYNIIYNTNSLKWNYEYIQKNSYILNTDNEGNVYLNVSNLVQGHYVLTVSYNGDSENYPADPITNTINVVGLSENNGKGNSIYNGESLSEYLSPSTDVQSTNPIIINLAKQITANCPTNTEKAFAIFDYVSAEIEYELYGGTKYGALRTLELKKGNCVDQARLIVALARAAGIPSRHVQGPSHVWAQILIQEENIWLIADTTTDRCSKFGFWNMFSGTSYFA
ncbi:transglutaminase domain-containing protein [Methanobrevibacter sp. DSM 116169]|uniref:transglutaminase domain-containing protein n=1 Tax=Methanobrevibacter sp. DSM 116169 TaxID=3242727 RepID=UPI0038FBF096